MSIARIALPLASPEAAAKRLLNLVRKLLVKAPMQQLNATYACLCMLMHSKGGAVKPGLQNNTRQLLGLTAISLSATDYMLPRAMPINGIDVNTAAPLCHQDARGPGSSCTPSQ